MAAYEASELMAAKAEQESQERYDAKEAEQEQYEKECERLAARALNDGYRWSDVLEAAYSCLSRLQYQAVDDHMRQMALSVPFTDEWEHHRQALHALLTRAVDVGCLLEDED